MEQAVISLAQRGATRDRPKMIPVTWLYHLPQTKQLPPEEAKRAIIEMVDSSVSKAIEDFGQRFPGSVVDSINWNGYNIIVKGKRRETDKEMKQRKDNEERLKKFKEQNAEAEKKKDLKEYERIKKKYKLT